MAYLYQPIYGVESYENVAGVPLSDAFGGGAKVTKDNLVITLWEVTSEGDFGPNGGNLLRPFNGTSEYQLALAGAAAQDIGLAGIYTQFCKSRYSARFIVEDLDGDPLIGDELMAMMQPPQDLANSILGMAKGFQTSSNAFGKKIDFLHTGFGVFMWDFLATDTQNVDQQEIAIFGDWAAIPALGIGFGLPLYKTSGADGVFPEIYDISTNQATAQTIEALADGEPFFVPCLFTRDESFDTDELEIFTIAWKGSNARR
jgi:hypothetical protein